jgi:hypothetical protein
MLRQVKTLNNPLDVYGGYLADKAAAGRADLNGSV